MTISPRAAVLDSSDDLNVAGRRGHRFDPCKHKRSEEHTSELQSRLHLVCRLLLEKKKKNKLIQATGHTRTEHPGILTSATHTKRLYSSSDKNVPTSGARACKQEHKYALES